MSQIIKKEGKMTLLEEIRKKYTTMAKKADKGSAMASIRLNCLVCCGGIPSEVKDCTCPDCPLYRFRTGKKTK